jgi:hypothetical protein
MLEETTLLDYLDEEVVDKRGVLVGTLACYWTAPDGQPAFYGVKLEGHTVIRVVPVRFSQPDGRHCCIRLGYDLSDVEAAPRWDCSQDLNLSLQNKVNAHFGLGKASTTQELKYHAPETISAHARADNPESTTARSRYLIQILLPLYDRQHHPWPREEFRRIQSELTANFGGVTAYARALPQAAWTEESEPANRDERLIFEVTASEVDDRWWNGYRQGLESRFKQEALVIRAQPIRLL